MRALAFLLDAAFLIGVGVLLFLLNVMSLFVFSPITTVAMAIAPLVYTTVMIGHFGGATLGMKLVGLRVVKAGSKERSQEAPNLVQSFFMTVLFYASLNFGGLPLLWAFFDKEGRFLHDIFSGVRVQAA